MWFFLFYDDRKEERGVQREGRVDHPPVSLKENERTGDILSGIIGGHREYVGSENFASVHT